MYFVIKKEFSRYPGLQMQEEMYMRWLDLPENEPGKYTNTNQRPNIIE
jgi:hypothetical protein